MLFVIFHLKRKKDLKKISDKPNIKIFNSNSASRILKFALIAFIILFTIFAFMRPKWGTRAVSITKSGFEVVFLLDVSPSMLAIDVKPNRLDIAKTVISNIIDELKGNKFALVSFSGEPTVDPPLTDDIETFKDFYLKIANVEQIPTKGTIYEKAIMLADELFSKRIDIGKTIIIVSDGEAHDNSAPSLVEKLYKDKGIITHTVGIGTEEGSYIPESDGSKKLTSSGDVVKTKLVKETLVDIANKGGGVCILYNEKNNLNPIYEKLNQLKKGKLGTKNMQIMKDQYQYFVLICVILFIVYFLIPERTINFRPLFTRKIKSK